MRRLVSGWMAVTLLGVCVLPAKGQVYVQWNPVQRQAFQPVVASEAPAMVNYGPTVNTSTTVSTRWEPAEPAPAPTAYAAPAVNYTPAPSYAAPAPYAVAGSYAPAANYAAPATYAPVANYVPTAGYAPAANYVPAYVPVTARYANPAVPYVPVVARYPAPTYVTYAPVANNYLPAAPVAAGPKVWVHPKVYVEGQPIRNLLRAITP